MATGQERSTSAWVELARVACSSMCATCAQRTVGWAVQWQPHAFVQRRKDGNITSSISETALRRRPARAGVAGCITDVRGQSTTKCVGGPAEAKRFSNLNVPSGPRRRAWASRAKRGTGGQVAATLLLSRQQWHRSAKKRCTFVM